ncbi:MAG: hypothetical protein ABIQ73_02015 [Acidimicrobiales bacterium]
MDPQKVLALCHEHAEAEAAYDVDRVLATLVAEPRFEFFPLRKHITGRAPIEKFYREQYPQFGPLVAGYEVIGEWTNEIAALQEYTIDVDDVDGSTSRYYVISMMPGDDATGLLSGERLYCDEGFVRALLGPLFDLLEPID